MQTHEIFPPPEAYDFETFDDVLAAMDARFWRDDTIWDPVGTIPIIMLEMDDDQFENLARIVYDGALREVGDDTSLDFEAAFAQYSYGDSTRQRRGDFLAWAMQAGSDVYQYGILRHKYNVFMTNRLMEEGASHMRLGWMLEVLQIEYERRILRSEGLMQQYQEHREGGGTMDEFLDTHLPEMFVRLGTVGIAEETPDVDEKLSFEEELACAKRFVDANRQHYELLEVTYQKDVHGVEPEYWSRYKDEQ